MDKVLIIDDEQDILNLLERFFIRLKLEPVTTDSWEEGLRLFREKDFPLVVLDVNMPGRDGFHVAEDLKRMKPNQKIIIITGLGPGEAYQYLSALENVDVNDILYKPFKLKKLEKIVTKALKP